MSIKTQLEAQQADFNQVMEELAEAAPVLQQMFEKAKPVLENVAAPAMSTLLDALYNNPAFDRLVIMGMAGQLAKSLVASDKSPEEVASRCLEISTLVVKGARAK